MIENTGLLAAEKIGNNFAKSDPITGDIERHIEGLEQQREVDRETIRELHEQADADQATIRALHAQAELDRAVIDHLEAEGLLGREKIANLEIALGTARRIGAAMGVLMARQKVTDAMAFDLLRDASHDSQRKLRDVADVVLMTGALPDMPRRS